MKLDKPEIKDDNFIVIQHWMISEKNLSGNDLLVYAAIYGFSQDNRSTYNAGYDWLARFIGCSKRTIMRICQNLEERGLIKKESVSQGRQKFNFFSANRCQNVTSDKMSPVTKCHDTSDKMSPNNKYINNIYSSLRSEYIETTAKFEPRKALFELGCKGQVISDFLAHRKFRKAKFTETALEGFVREASKAGISLNDALIVCIERNWIGFKADWYTKDAPKSMSLEDTIRQRHTVEINPFGETRCLEALQNTSC